MPHVYSDPLTTRLCGAERVCIDGDDIYFKEKGCLYCHRIDGHGGMRGPDLSYIGDRLSSDELTWRIMNGGLNMPGFGGTLSNDELTDLVEFLKTRKRAAPQFLSPEGD